MASGTTVVTPSNEANIIQMAPGLPSGAPQQVPQKGPLERFFNAEPKVLGAIQILIGLIHIGFGAIPIRFFPEHYLPFSAIGGCTFLGGIFVKSSVGMNITSAVMALIDIILHMCEVALSISALRRLDFFNVGCALSILLFLFSLLEFFIAVLLAHFGCQATCYSGAQPTMVSVPYEVIGGGEIAAEPNPLPPPPTYDNMVTKSQ